MSHMMSLFMVLAEQSNPMNSMASPNWVFSCCIMAPISRCSITSCSISADMTSTCSLGMLFTRVAMASNLFSCLTNLAAKSGMVRWMGSPVTGRILDAATDEPSPSSLLVGVPS
ncbi:hypothetical protein CTI12_AA000920 [Artemisia annua]|uniref:Uncharacterized protein n=1 Tax=Artemisia annua TaxID=35608 RepID=A0A2U1QN05_ARTAN|nr:hypothetical protein CTI12_AA000920 [Artemisia annua]